MKAQLGHVIDKFSGSTHSKIMVIAKVTEDLPTTQKTWLGIWVNELSLNPYRGSF